MDEILNTKTSFLHFRISRIEGDVLREFASCLHLSISELVRLLVAKGLAELLREVGNDNATAG